MKKNEETDEEIIQRFKDFAQKSNAFYGDDIIDWRADRDFAEGDQWDDQLQKNFGSDRPHPVVNAIDAMVNTVVNPLLKSPYQIEYIGKRPEDQAEVLNTFSKEIMESSQLKSIEEKALHDATAFGIGGFFVTTVAKDEDVEIEVDPISDPTNLILDPNSIELDGSDMEQCAYVEYISKRQAKMRYGDDVVSDLGAPLVSNFGSSWEATKDQLQLVTYYEKNEAAGTVNIYKMLGDRIVLKVILELRFIPIVIVKGQLTRKYGKDTCRGITDKARSLQININLIQAQLSERMVHAPKPQISISKEALEGNLQWYQNMDKNMRPLLVYNAKDKNGNELKAPSRVDNTVPYEDLTGILTAERALLTQVSGVPTDGLSSRTDKNETAESILLRTKSNENNVSHFNEHLKTSMRQLGNILLDFYSLKADTTNENNIPIPFNVNGFSIQIINGPELVTTKLDARRDLLALSNFYTTETKPVIGWGIAKTFDNPELKGLSQMLAKLLPPECLSDQIPQIATLQKQMKEMEQKAQQALMQKDKTINDLTQQIYQLQLRTNSDVTIEALKDKTNLQMKQMELAEKVASQQSKQSNDNLQLTAKLNAQNHKLDTDDISKMANQAIDNKNSLIAQHQNIVDETMKASALEQQKFNNEKQMLDYKNIGGAVGESLLQNMANTMQGEMPMQPMQGGMQGGAPNGMPPMGNPISGSMQPYVRPYIANQRQQIVNLGK